MDVTKIAGQNGSADISALASATSDIVSCIKKLRSALGQKAELLDRSLLGVLTVLNQSAISDFTNGVFEDINSDLRQLCADIRDGTERPEHPFYK